MNATMNEWEPSLTPEECNNGELGQCYCGECESISWGELANLTHKEQVARFNWCSCEEQEEFPYDDCPRMKESEL